MSTQGIHNEGNITFSAAKTIKERFLFGAFVDGKITPVENGKHRAIAVITDCANQNDPINVQILGSNSSTMKVLADGVITIGDFITVNASSKAVSLENQTKGSYQICGVALSNASAGQHVEFTPTLGLIITK